MQKFSRKAEYNWVTNGVRLCAGYLTNFFWEGYMADASDFFELNGMQFHHHALLSEVASRLKDLGPTSIIALARKGPRLLSIMKMMDIELPKVPIWTDNALSFLTKEEIGETPVIFDDVVIVGTTLYKLQKDLFERFGIHAPVVAVASDTEDFEPLLVKDLRVVERLPVADVHQLSSEIIRSVPLLGLPLDLDHPVFAIREPNGTAFFHEIVEKAASAHRERLSLQIGNRYAITVFHFTCSFSGTIKKIISLLGQPPVAKLKVQESSVVPELRCVSVVCFPILQKEYLNHLWDELNLPTGINDSLNKYQLLCFAGALAFGQELSSHLSMDSLITSEAISNMGNKGFESAKEVLKIIEAVPDDLIDKVAAERKLYMNVSAFGKAFVNTAEEWEEEYAQVEKDQILFPFWRSIFRKIEKPYREALHDAVSKEMPIDEFFETDLAKRLQGGFTGNWLYENVHSDNRILASLELDIAVDSGLAVPVFSETSELVGRVYHHGENIWNGDRFSALICKAMVEAGFEKKAIDKIGFEKFLVVLHRLGLSPNAPLFSRVTHYLTNPKVEELSMKAVMVKPGVRLHGHTLEMASPRRGLSVSGEREWLSATPGVYWLEKKAGVLKPGKGGKGLILNPKAKSEFLTEQSVPDEVADPVAGLLELLFENLPKKLNVKRSIIEKDDIIRLLSSCLTKEDFLRAIAEDAILLAQERFEKKNQKFWYSPEARRASGEILKKWQVYLLRMPIFEELRNYLFSQNLKNDWRCITFPLLKTSEKKLHENVSNMIEKRALHLFACVESLASKLTHSTLSELTQAAIRYLVEKGYELPDSVENLEKGADEICKEVLDMFPSLLRNLIEDDVSDGKIQFFIFSDMRDSSLPQNVDRAEKAKGMLLDRLKMLEDSTDRFHFNVDKNDEKNVFFSHDISFDPPEPIQRIYSVYVTHGLYSRIGIVSNFDTMESVDEIPPSAPRSFNLSKRIAQFLRESNDSQELRSLDERHKEQNWGIISITRKAMDFIGSPAQFLNKDESSSVKDFLRSSLEAVVKVTESEAEVERIGRVPFVVFLYR